MGLGGGASLFSLHSLPSLPSFLPSRPLPRLRPSHLRSVDPRPLNLASQLTLPPFPPLSSVPRPSFSRNPSSFHGRSTHALRSTPSRLPHAILRSTSSRFPRSSSSWVQASHGIVSGPSPFLLFPAARACTRIEADSLSLFLSPLPALVLLLPVSLLRDSGRRCRLELARTERGSKTKRGCFEGSFRQTRSEWMGCRL